MRLLIAASDLALAQRQFDRWRAAGLRSALLGEGHNLVRDVVRVAPQALVWCAEAVDAPALAALRAVADGQPLPVLVVGDQPPDGDLLALVQANVWAWLPAAVAPVALTAAAALAVAHWQAATTAAAQLAGAQARLDERVWVDRAKGLLMAHQHLSEADAFAWLRAASMHANLRLGEVSRGLIEAAEAAEAVNRAGQLRMLSQRVVKALALRQAAVDRAAAADLLADSLQRLAPNLERLAALPLDAPAGAQWAAAQRAGAALQACATAVPAAGAAPARAALAQADDAAEALLHAADALTVALESAGARPGLQVVNLCGRQRMLAQRLVKQVLLASLLDAPMAAAQADAAQQTQAEFAQALQSLEQAPLANDEIHALLAQARAQWQRLLQGVQRSHGAAPPGPAAGPKPAWRTVAAESEALLTSFDRLTSVYEHSLQVLLG
jgi:AmiR/NasT family two-component response regulator